MKQTLSIKLGQSLTMTPQLQQAIRLLQLSSLELEQEVQENLESNPMLELDEEEVPADGNQSLEPPGEADEQLETSSETGELDASGMMEIDESIMSDQDDPTMTDGMTDDSHDPAESAEADMGSSQPDDGNPSEDQAIPDDLPVDTSWDDIYEPAATPASGASTPADSDWSIDERNSLSESLNDHLLWQLNLTPMSDTDRMIATTIIDAIDPDGMLTLSLEDIATSLNPVELNGHHEDVLIELDEVVAVLKRIQQFDPTGIAARDLAECLMLQLQALELDTLWRTQALDLVADHLELLASRDFTALKRKTRLGEQDLAAVVNLIQSLNPRPGASITSEEPEYIVPDVIVTRHNSRWHVELNPETTPRLKINDVYAGMVKRADSSADNTYLKDNLAEARWFLKSLQSRNETLLKVATQIVEHQRGFLEYGEEAMKPLVLHDIAEAVDMHESTISRVTSRKYMHTPRGIFELKYFFSSHVSTNTGGEVSSTAIRALIKKFTSEENPKKPLSDNKIAAILAEQNIRVARRTVAKYRESMAIPPSNERKRLL